MSNIEAEQTETGVSFRIANHWWHFDYETHWLTLDGKFVAECCCDHNAISTVIALLN